MKPSTTLLLVIALVVLFRAETASAQQADVPQKKEFSIVGTWKGTPVKDGSALTITLICKQGGAHAMVNESGDSVLASSGTYKVADGEVTFTYYQSFFGPPASADTAKIAWVNADRFSLTQGGVTVAFQRVK